MSTARTAAAALLAAAALPALATSPPFLPEPAPPPKVLQVYVEDIVPGHEGVHAEVERAWAKAAFDARLPDPIVEYVPVFGPRQCWVVNGFDSFAAVEKADARIAATKGLPEKLAKLLARDRGVVAAERTLALVLRPDLGRSVAVPWAQARYQWIHTIQVRPGQEPAFEKEMKRLAAAYDKAGVPFAWFTYQVLAGMNGPTYLVVNPLRSLAELDEFIAAQRKVVGALGEEGIQAALKAATDGYAWVDSVLLAVQPRASYVPAAWVKEAPEVWKGAFVVPAAAPAPAAK